MKQYAFLIMLILVLALQVNAGGKKPKVLVFMKTAGFYHKSIPAGARAIIALGQQNGFVTDTTRNADAFTAANLKQYAAVVFLNTTGTVLNDAQKSAFQHYIKKGGGFVGVHAATDTEYDWPWYNELAGAYFLSHPKQQKATILVKDRSHISTAHLPEKWERFDEWYNFKNISNNIKILMWLDEKSYEGGKNSEHHPIAWYHAYDGGRAFYTGLGHTDESYSEPLFLQHLLGGIKYAIGKKR